MEDTGNQEFILTEPGGDLYRYHSFSAAANLQGRLKSVTSAGDTVATLTYDISTGSLTKFEQSSGSESVVYDYNYTGGGSTSGSGGLGLLQDVTLKINGTKTRRAVYSYYGVSSARGNYNDLEKATVQQWTTSVWKDLRTTYHRYWTSDAGAGVKHGLKYLLKPQGYLDMKKAGLPPETTSDANIALYASHYFEYNSARGVSKEITDGGKHTYTFAYETSSLAAGNNNWKTRTTEGRPDGSQVIVYTNHAMGVILKILSKGADKWYHYVKYEDARYRAILIASSEAVSSVNTPTAGQALTVTLKSSEGLITTKSWYPSSSGVGAKDYLKYTAVKKGSAGTEIKQKELEYTSKTVGNRTVYKVGKETLYLNDTAPLKTSVTTHAYTWHTGTVQIDQHTITPPTVPTGENGSGQSYQRKTALDLKGRVLWEQDERGVINGYTYDAATGARKAMIQDSASGGGSGVPSGWTTSSSSPLGLTTDYEIDSMGRRTRKLGPVHQIDLNGTPANVRTADYTVYRDDLFEVRTARGYENGGAETTINPVTIEKRDADSRVVGEIKATRSGGGRLSANDIFPQSSYLRWRTRFYNDADQQVWERIYYDIPATQDDVGIEGTNFDQMDYGYDAMGRRNRNVSGGGTIERIIFDTRGLPLETWIGTNDTGATDSDPDGSGGSNNMVRVSTRQYDLGIAGGNGNLTGFTLYVSGSESRETQFGYDWRNRQTIIDGEENIYRNVTYNNQDQALVTQTYDGSSSGTLLSKSEKFYDILSREYRDKTFAVSGGSVALSRFLESDTYYDATGQTIKQRAPGSKAWRKTVFDSLGRDTASFLSYPEDGTEDGNTNEVTDDVVMEQSETVYDAASNAITTRRLLRFHDAPATGAGSKGSLNVPSGSNPKSRVYYQHQYPDAIGRIRATADYGTSSTARSSTVPSTSATRLVRSMTFTDAGDVGTNTDPEGVVFKQEYDDAGRVKTEIENFLLGSSAADSNNTKSHTYTGDGLRKTLTWNNATTGSQVTTWQYGTTLAASGVASSQLLVKKIYPDGGDDYIDFTYNRLGELLTKTDQNGNVHGFQYNKLGQPLHDRVTTLGAGVDGAVRRISTTYDQRHRLETITSWDNATVGSGSVVNQVKRTYDDFDQLASDLQEPDGAVDGATLGVAYAHENGSNNTIRPTTTTYPDGRQIEFTYGSGTPDDILSRIGGVRDLGKSSGTGDDKQLASYQYLGYNTPVIAAYPEPGVSLTYVAQSGETQLYGDPYNGLDWFDRIADQRWIKGSADLERVTYGYNENSLREWRRNLVATSADKQDESYAYDGLFQIKDRDRGVLTSGNVMTNITEREDWTYDASGNWLAYQHLENGSTLSQTRTHSKVNEIATYNANATPREYDKAGNMTRIPEGVTTTSIYRIATWDAWNRLRRVRKTNGTGSTSGTNFDVWYDYDGLTRRTQKRIVGGANQGTTDYYYNSNWKCIEERKSGVSGPSRQYVFGVRGRNDLILRDRDTNNNGTVLEERLYALTDAMGSVTTITDKAGAVKERFRYTAFGESQVMTPAFASRNISSYDWQTRFHGEQRDAETGYYNYGYRYYLPELGRWPSRDPIEERGGVNLYGMVHNDSLNFVDVLGHGEFGATVGGAIGGVVGGIIGGGAGGAAGGIGGTAVAPGVGTVGGAAVGGTEGAIAGAALGAIGGAAVGHFIEEAADALASAANDAAEDAACVASYVACKAVEWCRKDKRSCSDCLHSCYNDRSWPSDC